MLSHRLRFKLMPETKKAIIRFRQINQQTHNLSEHPNSNGMSSTIDFDVRIGPEFYLNLRVQIRQPYGTEFAETFEIGRIQGFYGPLALDREQFSRACEEYYRGWIGSSGRGIRIGEKAQIMMQNNAFCGPKLVAIDLVSAPSNAAW